MNGCISVFLTFFFFNGSMSIDSKYKLLFSSSLGFHLLQFLNFVICSLIKLFFKCIKLHLIWSQFFTINFAQVLDIQIAIVPSLLKLLISSTYTRWQIGTTSDATKKEGLFWHNIFKKNILPRVFFNLVPKESFAPKCTFSIKFRS